MPKKKNKILLAEDDRLICRAYEASLKQEGFDVVCAHDGEEALQKLGEFTPDLILLDLIMPNKNGFEFLEAIKPDAKLKKIPVIVLSNLGQESDIERAKALGAVGYLIKSDSSIQKIVEKASEYLK